MSHAPLTMVTKTIDVSVIIPVYNGGQWLEECLLAILDQEFTGTLEVSIYNDASTDSTPAIMDSLRHKFLSRCIGYVTGCNSSHAPSGAGTSRNNAIKQSTGQYLCLQDADDVMLPHRIQMQYELSRATSMNLIGGRFTRQPVSSTPRYTQWCNSLSNAQLYTQGYTSFGPTLILPTWFMPRRLYDKYGPFDEGGKGTPEDLLFYYKVLHAREHMARVDTPQVVYRYHDNCATHSVKEQTLWRLRVNVLEDHVISEWGQFTIWNAGKQGRRLYRSMRRENQLKVVAFCDVDSKKIDKKYYTHEESEVIPKPKVPIVHYKQATPPFVLCVKWGLTNGEFESNLDSLGLMEGRDYYNFS